MIKQGFKHPFLLLLHDIARSQGTGAAVIVSIKKTERRKTPLPLKVGNKMTEKDKVEERKGVKRMENELPIQLLLKFLDSPANRR